MTMMKIEPFALERYFARHEFSAEYLLSCSDCEALHLEELLEMADTESMRLWENLKFGYTETLGHPVLRESIASIYEGINADDILVTVPEEGIFLTMQALLEPGDHVICTFPGYQSLHELARSMGCRVTMWESEERSGWRFSVDHLENLIRDDTKLVVVNFPHNPTGFVPTRDEYSSVVDLVRQRNAYLLSDEMYRFLEVEPGSTLPAGCELYDKAISLFGLSKTFGLPGLRIGWISTRDHDVIERMSLLKDYITICNSAPSEILGLIAVRCRERIIARHQARIRKNMEVLEAFFAKQHKVFSWNRPLGGSVCFPRMLLFEDTFEFCEKLIRETGIMLVPSRLFQYGDHHVRTGFGRRNLPEAVELLSDYLDLLQR
jgi:aspartate/methionine/tyrosine aminotransferase